MRARLTGVSKSHGAQVVLEDASLEIGPHARVGLVGPNGVGKSTVLRLLAGEEAPDRGAVALDPPTLTVAHLPQEPDALRRGDAARAPRPANRGRRGRARARGRGGRAVDGRRACVESTRASDRYDLALRRLLAIGGADFDARAASVCAELGLGAALERPLTALSGGETARASLAAVLLAQADLLLLDEPTNDLDADGLERLTRFVVGYRGAVVLVSHDRAFLDSTVDRIAEIDPRSRRIVEWSGGWSDYVARRDEARRAAYARLARRGGAPPRAHVAPLDAADRGAVAGPGWVRSRVARIAEERTPSARRCDRRSGCSSGTRCRRSRSSRGSSGSSSARPAG